ncbi:FAD-dependent oxidoreductase [Hyphomonadaceae bacterium ML37]|nr:FAD-dependent oxidoreductase [Hyphomonadaceae bacterium ML37]
MGATTQPASTPDINYTFNDEQLARLMAWGEVRRHAEGAVLSAFGERCTDMLVTVSGETHIFIDSPTGPVRRGWMERGQFAGDIAVLTGAAVMGRTVMGKAGEVLHIPFARFQRLLVEDSELSDIFVRALTARRAFAVSTRFGALIVIGAPYDRQLFAMRDFLTRQGAPHTWLDPDTDPLAEPVMEAMGLTRSDLPAVVLGAAQVMRHPDVDALAAALGYGVLPEEGEVDVVVVGAGPAGLAASVYAGSEGLSVVTLDAEAPGGQAGASSKIENYLGFPTGVSGRELAERAAVQAQKFGVRLAAPVRAAALEPRADGRYALRMRDGRTLIARAVVIATGAQYRRLPLDGLEAMEGAGIYYGASALEGQLCAGAEVCVVGAGNSAGQGAVYLARTAKRVHVIYRRPDLRETMSEYLVRRLEETPNITLHPGSEIATLHSNDAARPEDLRLTALTLDAPGGPVRLDAPFAFLFIGAAPFTGWLPEPVARDARGFVKTGAALADADLAAAGWRRQRPPSPYETSLERVYAVGDVRAGSVKRVASAVGEGSVTVSDIHAALAEMGAGG